MSDNVISIVERIAERRTDSNADPGASEARHRAAEEGRLRAIKEAAGRKGALLRWPNREDRLRAAGALGDLKNELIAHGLIVDRVEERFPKLYRYINGEVKKVLPYLMAAEHIGEIAGLDTKESQLQILRSTTLWQNWGRSDRSNTPQSFVDERANNVAFLLEKLVARVVRDSALVDLFGRMRRVPGQWDIRTVSFRSSGMACLFQRAYQDWFEMWNEAPPLPSVPLVRLWHGGLSFRALLSREASAEPIAPHTILAPVTSEEGDERQAELHIYREIRLALGPTVNANTLGPMFESRAYVELAILGEDGKISCQGSLDFDSRWNLPSLNPDDSAAVFLNDCWHRFTPLTVLDPSESFEERAAPFLWDFTPLADEKQCFENWWLSWTPVDAAHVAHWLDRPGDGRSQPVEFLPDAREPKSAPETWYPRPLLAHLVETAIADGRLEAALQAEIARIRKAFEIHETEWTTRMREQTAEQIIKFDSDLTAANTLRNQQMETGNDQQP